ncbi:MAG TPA: NADH-quinone oxidoreductase subunit C [Dictyobacter sp.]|jgi:NADH-quinone oxidoreductase subunit C|nr:NADH-quinone oxidoreductase subunit C [Dictyobacter sp.]
MTITATSTVEMVRNKFSQAVVETTTFRAEQTIVLHPDSLTEVCMFLLKDAHYNFLETITAVDWPERLPRFDVIYQLLSIPEQSYIRLKVRVGQRRETEPHLPSVTHIWPGANWYEREVFDLFGIIFDHHPNLQRILMPADWTTYPLRKDYPLTGFELPEPHWGGQVPYDVDPGVGEYYTQTLRSPEGREFNESRSKVNPDQEPGTNARPVPTVDRVRQNGKSNEG